ncbi:hypothetical protein [Mycolicibacterium sp. HS_4_1]
MVYNHIRDIIKRGVADREFRDCDAQLVTLGYIGMTPGSHQWIAPTSSSCADRMAGDIRPALPHGLECGTAPDDAQNISAV